jgi:cell division protein FtsI (penicillin-binding protein 3)
MYVNQKSPNLYAAKKDSSAYFYAGNTDDIKNVFATLNVSYTDSAVKENWGNVFAANYQAVIKGSSVRNQVMPNVKGMGLKDALFLLESMGLKVSVKGKGKVTNQSIEAGSALSKEMKVVLELS